MEVAEQATTMETAAAPIVAIAATRSAVTRHRRDLTGILLIGGGSARFGSPKAHAVVAGETLAERAWRTLGAACRYRVAVGKGDETLPFPVVADGVTVRAPIYGLAAGLRVAPTDLTVVLPVDCPLITVEALHALADRCLDAAITPAGPLPGAYRKNALRAFDGRELSIRRALTHLAVAVVPLDPGVLLNINTPAELRQAELALQEDAAGIDVRSAELASAPQGKLEA
jgi:molybdopterin-guanine dinucleotide biosynthesis protein A